MNSEAVYLLDFETWSPTQGWVTRISRTNASENDVTVMRIQYAYVVAGDTLTQTAYSTRNIPEEGSTLQVEYDQDDPQQARVKGLRRKMFGAGAILAAIFPLAGLIFIVIGYLKNSKDLNLVIHGFFARGKLIEKKATSTEINNQRVYAMTFEFEARNGQTYTVTSRTPHTHLLEDEETEQLLYLAENPEEATLFDTIAAAPPIQADGSLEELPIRRSRVLLLPAATLVGHGLYAVIRYGIL